MGVHGKNTYFGLDNAAGTLVDISQHLTDVSMPRQRDKAQDNGFKTNSKAYKFGLKDATITLTGNWNPTIHALIVGIENLDTTQTFEYGAGGNDTGDVKESGECNVESYERSNPVEGIVTFTVVLQVSGDIADGTFA